MEINILDTKIRTNGVENIGASQRVIAYTVVANNGDGTVRVTAAGHGLKKHQTIYIGSGDYAGIRTVKKVVSANTFDMVATWTATAAGNINLTASQYGEGFLVKVVPLTIAEFVSDDEGMDNAAIIAGPYIVGDVVPIPFSKIRVTAGDIQCIRKNGPPANLNYTNR